MDEGSPIRGILAGPQPGQVQPLDILAHEVEPLAVLVVGEDPATLADRLGHGRNAPSPPLRRSEKGAPRERPPSSRAEAIATAERLRLAFSDLEASDDEITRIRERLEAVPAIIVAAQANLAEGAADYLALSRFNADTFELPLNEGCRKLIALTVLPSLALAVMGGRGCIFS